MDPCPLEPDRARPLEVFQGALHDFTHRAHHCCNLLVRDARAGFWSPFDHVLVLPGTSEQETRHPRHHVPAYKVFDDMAP